MIVERELHNRFAVKEGKRYDLVLSQGFEDPQRMRMLVCVSVPCLANNNNVTCTVARQNAANKQA